MVPEPIVAPIGAAGEGFAGTRLTQYSPETLPPAPLSRVTSAPDLGTSTKKSAPTLVKRIGADLVWQM
ncbi:hypothetical protein D4768_08290 [Rhodococcus erythropolis]|nr:hypothetical protein D4768_08290 [Rhodococcus erythropolis]